MYLWLLFCVSALQYAVAAQNVTGIDGWLRYARIPNADSLRGQVPGRIIALNDSEMSPVFTAGQELMTGMSGILGANLDVSYSMGDKGSYRNATGTLIVGSMDQFEGASIDMGEEPELIEDGYHIAFSGSDVHIIGSNQRGALYGAFQLLAWLAQGRLPQDSYTSNPDAPVRWGNQWDNLQDGGNHGSVERGYAGDSIFFKDGGVREDLSRVPLYARLLASVGINALVVNNVNANESMVEPRIVEGLGRIADLMRPYGVRLGMSLNFATPELLGVLDTFDPFDESVIQFWQDRTDMIYSHIPDMAGYLVKANSEGQPGPLTYNRTLADGANLFARRVQPYGGIVMFRGFVYDSTSLNQTEDWRADRANAAVEFFDGLDGKFEDNVVVQIKYGPIDFQVREPASPLFAHLQNTSTAIELQVTQEYLGQQCHVFYYADLWKSVLDWDMRYEEKPSLVRDIIAGRRFNQPLGGYAAVINVGLNQTWLGSHLAMSNLYLYGRMSWDPTVSGEEVIQDWTRMTFNHNPDVIQTIKEISMESWPTYENYSGNLGIQTLADITGSHYGPDPASQDGNPWGQWTRADTFSIGMDRTVFNGTGFAGQYPAIVRNKYDNISTTPDDLLLWFHHVNYTYPLKESDETVIQHFYNAHYAGAANAQTYAPRWEALKGKMNQQQYEEQLYRLIYQGGHSIVWRDTINQFYYNLSSIPDEQNRGGCGGDFPYRIEAESMELDGYNVTIADPWNTASSGRLIAASSNDTATATATVPDSLLTSNSSTYDVAVNYFDVAIGIAHWTLYLNDRMVGEWKGDMEYQLGHAPAVAINGDSNTRITFHDVEVQSGDVLKIVGEPEREDVAAVDYISIFPPGVVD
ncbi:alpha glucuronidase [Hortaea werneckii]|uniref:Alpha-glucuronidase n=1 Tax=Hortaea werneckii TaxID=91943 RepID=A0A3M7CI39_HORWE|nr:alpha glucuronidase [Hortaea werneckii]RMY51808.1 hypothetical protein D0865_06135 [Hortaea werneckii]